MHQPGLRNAFVKNNGYDWWKETLFIKQMSKVSFTNHSHVVPNPANRVLLYL